MLILFSVPASQVLTAYQDCQERCEIGIYFAIFHSRALDAFLQGTVCLGLEDVRPKCLVAVKPVFICQFFELVWNPASFFPDFIKLV